MSTPAKMQKQLLEWYDRHRRVMPWRALPGKLPNPYHVWLSEIMLQQTTVVTVGPYFNKFIGLWPTVKKLAAADLDDVLAAWAGLGYYARARNLHKGAKAVVSDFGGTFPETQEELLTLPGIGPYTAAAISSIAFDRPAVAVDGNVERVVSRVFAIFDPLPKSKPQIKERAAYLAQKVSRPGDFTQAFMELGATVCTPRNPKCTHCPWQKNCEAYAQNVQEKLPKKSPKATKPQRFGKVFWIQRANGDFLLQKRSQKGLYEGMYQLPTSEWLTDAQKASQLPPLFAGKATDTGAQVRHSFTHFDLTLDIWAQKPVKAMESAGVWVSRRDLPRYAVPTLMKKAILSCLAFVSGDSKDEKG